MIRVLATILILAASNFGQVVHVFPATDTDNIFTGSNQFNKSVLLGEAVCTSGAVGVDIICADPTTHRVLINPNGAGAIILSGIAAAGTSGHCVQLASNGIDLVDSGSGCGVGGGGVTGSGTSPHLAAWIGNTAIGDTVVSYASNGLTFNPPGTSWAMNTLASQLTIGTTATAGATNDQITLQVGAGPTGVGGSDIRLFAGAAGSGATSGGNVEIDSGYNGSNSGGKITVLTASSPNTGGVRGTIFGGGGFWLSDDANGMYFRLTGSTGGGQVPIRVGSGVPSFNCGAPTVYLNSAAATASTFVYVCISGTTWTALTVP